MNRKLIRNRTLIVGQGVESWLDEFGPADWLGSHGQHVIIVDSRAGSQMLFSGVSTRDYHSARSNLLGQGMYGLYWFQLEWQTPSLIDNSMSREAEDGLARAQQAMIQRLESLHRAGVNQLKYVREGAMDVDTNSSQTTTAEANSGADLSTRTKLLNVLAAEVAGCTRCSELARTRTQTVFGVGNPEARLCFFGEAPGADEDRLGEPFVGRAGQLLTKIIEACALKREDVYILNVLKCRPPGNRNPTDLESQFCSTFYERQLEIIRPDFICCLGSVAAKTLLETTQSIGKLRGRFHLWRDIRVIATYHPAYLLRNPTAKRSVWEDMQMLISAMGIELPQA